MKKALIFLVSAIVVGLALNAHAASVTFDPSLIEFKVPPGETGKTPLTIHGFSSNTYNLNFRVGSKLGNGNVPLGWLNQVDVSLGSRTGGASSSSKELVVSVPADAEVGTYTGVLEPEVIRSSEPLSSPGVMIAIEVTEPLSTCTGHLEIDISDIKPTNIWAPTDRDIEIEISGNVSAGGCEVAAAGYTLNSNTGPIAGDITLEPDGSFSEKFTANLSRSGSDKDGKVYSGSLSAVDEEGNEKTVPFDVMVLHDKRDGNRPEK